MKKESNIKSSGYWISPENVFYKLQEQENHVQWLSGHKNLLENVSNNLFGDAINEGWIRLRIEHDSKNMSKLICNITAKSIELLKTLPDEAKDLIFSTDEIDISDINYSHGTVIPKEEFEKVLNRAQYSYANLKKKVTISKLDNIISFKSSFIGKFLYYKIVGQKVYISGANDKILFNFKAVGDLDKHFVVLEDIQINPDLRGKGYGRMVINEFIDICKGLEIKTITGIPKDESRFFWTKLNFPIKNNEITKNI